MYVYTIQMFDKIYKMVLKKIFSIKLLFKEIQFILIVNVKEFRKESKEKTKKERERERTA